VDPAPVPRRIPIDHVCSRARHACGGGAGHRLGSRACRGRRWVHPALRRWHWGATAPRDGARLPLGRYGEGLNPRALEDAVVAGALTLVIQAGWMDRPARAFAREPTLKVLALVRAGERVTLVVPGDERERLSLLYDVSGPVRRRPVRLSDGTRSVRFSACAESEEWIPGERYPDPRETQFNGGLFIGGAHCAAVDVWVEGEEEPLRRWLPLGTGPRPCPAEPASLAERGTSAHCRVAALPAELSHEIVPRWLSPLQPGPRSAIPSSRRSTRGPWPTSSRPDRRCP
jgi:hypothetical protein